jgi:hypothetical protein
MRFLVQVVTPHEPFNTLIKEGMVETKMQAILAETKPEAAYFTEINGRRTVLLIVNLNDVSQMPSVAEPWFLIFGADVEFHPVMLGEDLGRANLKEIGKKW